MADKNRPPKSKSRGSQSDHRAYIGRERHPRRFLRNVIRSNGPVAVRSYAQKYGLGATLKKLLEKPPRWIGRRMAPKPEGYVPAFRVVRRKHRVMALKKLRALVAKKNGKKKAAEWAQKHPRHGTAGILRRAMQELELAEKKAKEKAEAKKSTSAQAAAA